MPPIVTGNVGQHLIPGLRQIIGTDLGGREMYYSRIYNVGTSNRNSEDFLAATGLPVAAEKPQGTDIQSFAILEGSTKRLTPVVWAIGAEVSMEAWEDDLYKNQGSAIRLLSSGIADSLAENVEFQAHLPLLNATSTAAPYWVLPDQSALLATAHSPITGAYGGAQSNLISGDLSNTTLRQAVIAMRKWKDDQGKRIPGFSKPQKLIVAPDFEYDAMELLRSTARVDLNTTIAVPTGVASPGFNQNPGIINTMAGIVPELISDPYLSDDTDMWIIQSQRHFMEFLWRKRPSFDQFELPRSKVTVFTGIQRYVASAVHWLGTCGSIG